MDSLWYAFNGVLWFFIGALAVSLGASASRRIVEPASPDSEINRETGFSIEDFVQLFTKVFRRLLSRSECDECHAELPTRATIPVLWVMLPGCKNNCKLSLAQFWRYLLSEITGGIIMVILWINLSGNDEHLIWAISILFLLSFIVSLKEIRYSESQWALQSMPITSDLSASPISADRVPPVDEKSWYLSLIRSRVSNYTLVAGFALMGFGLIAPVHVDAQALGVVLLGWMGWLVGLRCDDHDHLENVEDEVFAGMSIRCLVIGMMLGTWCGIYLGMVIAILVVGIITVFGSILQNPVNRYMEEWCLLLGTIVILVVTVFVHLTPRRVIWYYMQIDVNGAGYSSDIVETLCITLGVFC